MPYGTAVLFDRMISNNPMEAWNAYSEELQKAGGRFSGAPTTIDREAIAEAAEGYVSALESTAVSMLRTLEIHNSETLENLKEITAQTREALTTVMDARDWQALNDILEDYLEFMFEAVLKQTVLNYQHSSKLLADIWSPWNNLMRKSVKSWFPHVDA